MSLIFMDGFSTYGTNEALTVRRGWMYIVSYGFVLDTGGRFYGGHILNTNSAGYWRLAIPGTPKSTLYFGMAVIKDEVATTSIPPDSEPTIGVMESAVEGYHVKIFANSVRGFTVKDHYDTTIGTSSAGVWPDNAWFYLELKLVVSATVGEVVIRVNGVEVLNLTNQDTKYSTDYIGILQLRCMSHDGDTKWDDFYIDDAQFHGDVAVATYTPDGDGNYTDFNPSAGSNYENVDDASPDDDSTYNEGSAKGDKDSYGITTSLPTVCVIKGVQVSNCLRKTGTLAVKTKEIARVNSTDYLGDELSLSTDYLYSKKIWENNPDTSNPWIPSEIDAAEFGVEVTAMSTTTTT